MRVLFLSRWLPYPPNNGTKLRVWDLLRGLSRDHDITLLTFAEESESGLGTAELRSLCREVVVVPWKGFEPASLKSRLGFLSPTPRSLVDTYSVAMAREVGARLRAGSFDRVIASQLGTAIYSHCFAGVPALFEEVELGLLRGERSGVGSPLLRLRRGLTWAKHRRFLAGLLHQYRGCTVVSSRERDLVAEVAPGFEPIEVIPNCVDVASYDGAEWAARPGEIVYTGSFRYFANHRAMVWFTGEVLPLVAAAVPDTHLTITGDPAGKSLPNMRNVTLAGLVDDIRPVVGGATVCVAPLLDGGGTRLKILEAMALRTPVVATTKGAEGLDARDGEHLLIADTPGAFADAVIRVLRTPELRRRLSDNAYQLVRGQYDWAGVMPRFLDLVDRIGH